MCEYDCETAIVIRLLTHPCTWESGFSSLLDTIQSNWLISTWVSFPSTPSTDIKMEKILSIARGCAYRDCTFSLFPPSKKASHWLLFVCCAVGIPNIISMMALVWRSQSTLISKAPIVYFSPLPWRTSLLDLLRTWWMRCSPRMQFDEKARLARWMRSSRTSLWLAMASMPFFQLSAWFMEKDWLQPSHCFWRLGRGEVTSGT